jgi:hypothetical protein
VTRDLRILLLGAAVGAAGCLGPDEDLTVRPGDTDDRRLIGEVEVSPTTLAIPGRVGERVVASVEVRNVGEHPLTLDAGFLPEDADGQLETDEVANGDRTLSPDRTFEMLVVCRLAGTAPAAGLLRIATNDRDTPTVDVDVRCDPPTDGDTDGG